MQTARANESEEAEDMLGRRRHERSRVLLAATIETSTSEYPAKLRNLSCIGALINGEHVPALDSYVTFKRGATSIASRVVWVVGNQFGLEFLEPIEEAEVLIHVGRPAPASAIAPPSDYRRPGLSGSAPLTAEQHAIAQAWAQGGAKSGME